MQLIIAVKKIYNAFAGDFAKVLHKFRTGMLHKSSPAFPPHDSQMLNRFGAVSSPLPAQPYDEQEPAKT